MKMKKVLIAGGYGETGLLIAQELSQEFSVVIVGRNLQKAQSAAQDVGGAAIPLQLDANNWDDVTSALASVALVVNCVDQLEPYNLLRAAIAQGKKYLDITPHESFVRAALGMKEQAVRSGACVLMCGGLMPGVVNVMARAAAERVGEVDEVRTVALLSMGDRFGAAALDYMLQVIPRPFQITADGAPAKARNLQRGFRHKFPPPLNTRMVYRYNFPDQFFYPTTLAARTAGSYLTLDPAWLMAVLAVAVRGGLGYLLRFKHVRSAMKGVFLGLQRISGGSPEWAISAQAKGSGGATTISLIGEHESKGTAAGAAVMARTLLGRGRCPRGIWLPEQLMNPDQFFASLAKLGLRVRVSDKGESSGPRLK